MHLSTQQKRWMGISVALLVFILYLRGQHARSRALRGMLSSGAVYTEVIGGSPGYTILNNVFVHKRQLPSPCPVVIQAESRASDINIATLSSNGNSRLSQLLVSPDGRLSDASKIDGAGILHIDDWKSVSKQRVKRVEGLTYWLEDDWQYSSHYYHFAAELLLGAYHSCSHAQLSLTPSAQKSRSKNPLPHCLPSNVVVPWVEWKDAHGLNEFVLEEAYGDPEVYDGDEWRKDNDDGDWRLFDQVILVDRNAAHLDQDSLNVQWNKMAWTAITSPSLPTFITPFSPAIQICQSLGHSSSRVEPGKSLRTRRVKILYANRQMTDRKLSQRAHDGLMDAFASMTTKGVTGIGKQVKIQVEVVDAEFERMTLKEQFGAACDADIVIGVHGMGLTHSMWMPKGGTLIELFPRESFLPDLWLIAQSSNHHHIAVWENEIHSELAWRSQGKPMNPDFLHDGREIELDSMFIRDMLLEVIRDMA